MHVCEISGPLSYTVLILSVSTIHLTFMCPHPPHWFVHSGLRSPHPTLNPRTFIPRSEFDWYPSLDQSTSTTTRTTQHDEKAVTQFFSS